MSFTIGIDLGGTIIKVGLLHEQRLLDRVRLVADSTAGLQAQLPELKTCIDTLLSRHGVSEQQFMGIGFSFAGLVNASTNRIISTNKKYEDGPDIDLVGWAGSNWGRPLFAENDARMALLGEWQHGAGKKCDNIVLITLGTGIGSAVLMEGKLLRGKHFQAGNLGGHFTVNHQGVACTCGNIGCMESEVSTWRLPELIKEHKRYDQSALKNESVIDFKSIFKHVESGDALAIEVFDHCLSIWSAGIVSMIHAFDPEQVILSGGVMQSGEKILPAFQKRTIRHAWTPWGKVQINQAKFINDAALYGADFLVRSNL